MAETKRIELPIEGMDCAECTRHVKKAVSAVPGVLTAEVYLMSEKAVIELDPVHTDLRSIEKAVTDSGYRVGTGSEPNPVLEEQISLGQRIGILTALIFAAILLIVIVGEFLGLFDVITELVPWWFGMLLVVVAGFPVFRSVAKAAIQRQVLAHTLMSIGVVAALVVGEWLTALIIVFFMRVGDYVESFTTDQARQAISKLTASSPQTAQIFQNGKLIEVKADEVKIGDIVVIRPGEKIPVDGEVVDGHATIDQSTITGESLPLDVGPGAHVFAATIAQLGSLKIKSTRVGPDTTYGKIIQMVEEAECQRSEVQRIADRFSLYFLPVVLTIAFLTYVISKDAMATAAVLVVACSCSIALATPIAMLASIGAAARSGLLIKGGKYIEALSGAEILLLDKTGTLTLGQPKVEVVLPLSNSSPEALLLLAASAERYSEHPIAAAIRVEALKSNLNLHEPSDFMAYPGMGIRANVDGVRVSVGRQKFVNKNDSFHRQDPSSDPRTRVFIGINDEVAGVFEISDTLRHEVPESLEEVRKLGLTRIELLTGDNEQVSSELAAKLGIAYRANLLPEEKIQAVKEYQEQGLKVIMVGDGVNDAPALVQADVGIAMGAAGSDIALEAADIALMRDDWLLVPELLHISQRTMRVVKMNLGFTGIYNIVGLALAALGLLPPILAAAAQSMPDLGILANSSRLLRQK